MSEENNGIAQDPVVIPEGTKTPANKQEDNIKAVVEALLFSSDKPLLIEQIKRVLDNLDTNQIRITLEELRTEYEEANRGMRIYEVAGDRSHSFLFIFKKIVQRPSEFGKIVPPRTGNTGHHRL